MKYAPLVWAALWRKPVEALLTWFAIIAAFTLFGLMNGLTNALHRLIENARTDVLDVNPRYADDLPMRLREQLSQMAGVTAVASVYGLYGYRVSPRDGIYIQLFDEGGSRAAPDLPLAVADWNRLMATPAGVFVSGKAAEHWGLKPGNVFTVTARDVERADGRISWAFEVLGITKEVAGWSNGYIVGNFRYVDQAKPLAKQGIVYYFQLALADPARADDLVRAIDRHFANSDTPTRSMTARFRAQNDATAQGGAITRRAPAVAAAGLFMILLLIANGIAQSVRERIPELAVLKTLGYRDEGLIALVFVESLIPCVIGALLGSALAVALAEYPHRELPAGLDSLPLPIVSYGSVALSVGCAVLLALLSTIVPTLRLKRLSVVDALAGR